MGTYYWTGGYIWNFVATVTFVRAQEGIHYTKPSFIGSSRCKLDACCIA